MYYRINKKPLIYNKYLFFRNLLKIYIKRITIIQYIFYIKENCLKKMIKNIF